VLGHSHSVFQFYSRYDERLHSSVLSYVGGGLAKGKSPRQGNLLNT
jgi:hypothetical protein